MQTRSLCVAAYVLAFCAPAFAHSPLTSTVPADEARVTQAPTTIAMTFGKKARLTKVVVTGPTEDDEFRLAVPTKSFAKVFDIDGAPQDAGAYTVRWRALGGDGHVLKGSFSYTVAPR